MAVALVQGGSLSTVVNAPPTPTFPATTGAGNLLVALLQSDGTSGVTTFATTSAGWSTARASSITGAGIFYKANSTGGDAAPTFTGGTTTTNKAVLLEFSGVVTTSPLDQNSQGASVTSPVSANSGVADAAVGELTVAVGQEFESKATTITWGVTTNADGSFTLRNEDQAVSSTNHFFLAYLLATTSVPGAGSNISASSTGKNVTSMVVTQASFKVPAPSGFQPRHPAINFQDPGLLMEGLGARWEHVRERIWLPNFGGLPATA